MSRTKGCNTRFEGTAPIKLVTFILVYVLFGSSLMEAKAGISARGDSPREETANKPTLQQRVLEVPSGTMVEVRLLSKQRLRGRLGDVGSDGFNLQTAQGSTISTQRVAFTDVKSFKQVEGTTGQKVGKGLIYALAGIGALMVVLIIVASAEVG